MMTIKEKSATVVGNDRKRLKYSDKMVSNQNLSSVNKLFLIGLVPEAQETHSNLKIILNELNLSSIPHTISSDLKCCANIAGKQQSMWSFPCIFCKISKEFVGVSPLLTVGELRAYRAAYVEAGEPHKDAREFHNVIFDILLDADDNFLVIDC